MSDFGINDIFDQIKKYEQQWTENREKELATIFQENDFIVGSLELKRQLEMILPSNANVVYSKYIDDPTMIYAVRKFDIYENFKKEIQMSIFSDYKVGALSDYEFEESCKSMDNEEMMQDFEEDDEDAESEDEE